MTAARKKTAQKKAAKTVKSKAVENKTRPTRESVTAFINAVENETRRRDARTLLALMKKVTGETPKMWGPSIIGFGAYRYKYESGREGDMCLVGFSPRKANSVLYVLASPASDEPLLEKLGTHKRGAGCLYINKLEDVDLGVLEKIIAKSYRETKNKWGA